MRIANHKSQTENAFTLVELLVVIGIIAILIGILIPVVNSARKSAYGASSRNQIQVIGNAIDRYYTDFGAYPGLFSNAQIDPSSGPGVSLSGNTLTSSENLLISLCGGAAGTGAAPTYVATDVGRGPLTFNAVQQKRMLPYTDATPQTISMTNGMMSRFADENHSWVKTGGTWGSNVPEFIDCYPGAMPIIYMRAKVGASSSAGTVIDTGSSANTYQYNFADLAAYGIPNTPMPTGSTFANWNAYFLNSSIPNTARRPDTYMLISPGPDRVYGTNDDICNFAFN